MAAPKQQFILPRALSRIGIIGRIALVLGALSMEQAWRIEIHEQIGRRTTQQNRYLWFLYGEIIRLGGESMAGWDKDDLHSFFLIEHFGHETKVLFGRKKLVPLRRSSRLSKIEFADFVDHIQRFMAERGVFLPDADPMYWENAA